MFAIVRPQTRSPVVTAAHLQSHGMQEVANAEGEVVEHGWMVALDWRQ